jgi:hypothetical protein
MVAGLLVFVQAGIFWIARHTLCTTIQFYETRFPRFGWR